MHILIFVVLFFISCGSPQDKAKNSDEPNGQGPQNGVLLDAENVPLLLTPCISSSDNRCNEHEKSVLNEIGYKQNDVKTITKGFSIHSDQPRTVLFDDLEFVNLSCKYNVRIDSPFEQLKIELVKDEVVTPLKVGEHFFIEAELDYLLRVSIENVFYCSDNWFRFSAVTL